jgi:hypothetical protein
MNARAAGSALVVGMLLLSVVSLLALAAASAAHVELQLARNEQFRENAANAASAGIEIAISRIVTDSTVNSAIFSGSLPQTADSFDVRIRFLGYEQPLPQAPDRNLAGAHFEIVATGRSGRGAMDRQRAIVMHVVESAAPVERRDCEPLTLERCLRPGELHRLSWQSLPSS